MCRVLIRLTPNPSPDKNKEKLLYQPGDVVLVVDDGVVFGAKIDDNNGNGKSINPKFGIISVSGIPAADYKFLEEPETSIMIIDDPDEPDDTVFVGRRKRNLDTAQLKTSERDDLKNSGGTTITKSSLDSIIKEKVG